MKSNAKMPLVQTPAAVERERERERLQFYKLIPLLIGIMLLCFGIKQTQAQSFTANLSPNSKIGGYHITCKNGNNGSITCQTTNGTAPLTYLWSTSDTGNTLNNLSAGIYSIIVTDANNATAIDTIELKEPSALNLDIDVRLLWSAYKKSM